MGTSPGAKNCTLLNVDIWSNVTGRSPLLVRSPTRTWLRTYFGSCATSRSTKLHPYYFSTIVV